MSTHYCDVISEKTWESQPRFSLLSACSLCRCIGVSHARHEQQCSSSIESQRAEPVCRSALQYAQCRLDAHAPLTQQVPLTLCALIIRTLSVSLLLLQTTNFFLQGNTAHEQPECAQSQPAGGGSNGAVRWDGRRRAWRWRREERQYGESQPVVTQHHRDAQTAASTAAVYHQQVTRITAVQM